MSVEEIITQQPIGDKSEGSKVKHLPAGLTILQGTNEVTIHQHVDPVEVVLCCLNRPCRYSVYAKDSEEQFLYIQEISECFARQIIGAARGFTLKFSDNNFIDTIHVIRPQTCSRGCCGVCCHLPQLQIQTPPGHTVASIKEKRTCCCPVYEIVDDEDKRIFTMSPSCCYLNIASDVCIDVIDEEETTVARLSKETQLNCKECIGLTNNFKLQYTADLSLTKKVILLGSIFLLDYHYFEKQQRYCC